MTFVLYAKIDFNFYKKRFESRIDVCYECDPNEYQEY